MVTGVTCRNPALLAKQVTALDFVSGGRAILGIGAAWNEDEHAGYGLDCPYSAGKVSWTTNSLMSGGP
jgi:alkanesulfonate monooxygenase SsuD/methylene tetrahydromethanopterin reductase-like flavin-dependent oxidoreductase (luciferase family)